MIKIIKNIMTFDHNSIIKIDLFRIPHDISCKIHQYFPLDNDCVLWLKRFNSKQNHMRCYADLLCDRMLWIEG